MLDHSRCKIEIGLPFIYSDVFLFCKIPRHNNTGLAKFKLL